MHDPQSLFNILVALVGFLGGWVLTSLPASIASLHDSDIQMVTKVQTIEVLVAGNN